MLENKFHSRGEVGNIRFSSLGMYMLRIISIIRFLYNWLLGSIILMGPSVLGLSSEKREGLY